MRESRKKTTKSDLKNEIKKEIKSELKNELKICSINIRELEVLNDHKPVPLNIANKVMKAICKITIKIKEIVII